MKNLLLVSLTMFLMGSSIAQSRPLCGIGLRFLTSNPETIAERLVSKVKRCVHQLLDGQWEMEYTARFHQSSEGKYVYYSDSGSEKFSTREFTTDEGSYFYFRDSSRNDFNSFKDFETSEGKYTYLRDRNRNDFFSMRVFGDTKNTYTYFRDNNRNDFVSIHLLNENGSSYLYFRDSSRIDFISIKNGSVLRDSSRNAITGNRFMEVFKTKFWEPIINKSVKIISETAP